MVFRLKMCHNCNKTESRLISGNEKPIIHNKCIRCERNVCDDCNDVITLKTIIKTLIIKQFAFICKTEIKCEIPSVTSDE